MITKIANDILHEIGPIDAIKAQGRMGGYILPTEEMSQYRRKALLDNKYSIAGATGLGAIAGGALAKYTGLPTATAATLAGLGGLGAGLGQVAKSDANAAMQLYADKGLKPHPEFLKRLIGRHTITDDAKKQYLS